MEARGLECRNLASFGRQLLSARRIRSFPYLGSGTASGWGGGGYGISLQRTWFIYYANSPSPEARPRNLAIAFADELYHEMHPSYNHLRGGMNPFDQQCSGL